MNTTIHIQHNGEMIPGNAIEVPHRQHNMYKIIFDNGYENVFYTDVESGKWIEEDLGFTQLAEKNWWANKINAPESLSRT